MNNQHAPTPSSPAAKQPWLLAEQIRKQAGKTREQLLSQMPSVEEQKRRAEELRASGASLSDEVDKMLAKAKSSRKS